MSAVPLRKIEAELAAMVQQNREHGTPICAHDLHCVVLKLGCQAELHERGLLDMGEKAA